MSKKIRVGIIRCDMHGVYYGTMIEKHDPLKLRTPKPADYPLRYGWETGGAHFYHYTHYADPRQITVDTVDGFEIVKVWDEHREMAELFSEIFLGKPIVCRDAEQVSDDVDLVFIADCDYEGKDHLDLARPGLEKGVATFIDKPFAYTVADVQKILALAAKHDAPVMSLSLLRSLPAAALFASRLAEIGECQFGTVQGGGTRLAGLIHSISLAQHVFGAGVQTVQQMTTEKQAIIHLDYGEREDRPRHGVAIQCFLGVVPHCAFYASAYGPKGRIHSPHLDDYVFPFGAAENLRKIRRMVQTRQAQAPREEMIECVAIAEASRMSQTQGASIRLADIV